MGYRRGIVTALCLLTAGQGAAEQDVSQDVRLAIQAAVDVLAGQSAEIHSVTRHGIVVQDDGTARVIGQFLPPATLSDAWEPLDQETVFGDAGKIAAMAELRQRHWFDVQMEARRLNVPRDSLVWTGQSETGWGVALDDDRVLPFDIGDDIATLRGLGLPESAELRTRLERGSVLYEDPVVSPQVPESIAGQRAHFAITSGLLAPVNNALSENADDLCPQSDNQQLMASCAFGVVAIMNAEGVIGSGVLIGPQTILTALHVLKRCDDGSAKFSDYYWFGGAAFDADVPDNNTLHRINPATIRAVAVDGGSNRDLACAGLLDLAVIHLDAPIETPPGYPSTFPIARLSAGVRLETAQVRGVGYGRGWSTDLPEGQRRAGEMRYVPCALTAACVDKPLHVTYEAMRPSESAPCFNDSGSPVLVQSGSGAAARMVVTGIFIQAIKTVTTPSGCENIGWFVDVTHPVLQAAIVATVSDAEYDATLFHDVTSLLQPETLAASLMRRN